MNLPIWRETHGVDCKYVPIEVHSGSPCSEIPHSTNGIKSTKRLYVVSGNLSKRVKGLTRK